MSNLDSKRPYAKPPLLILFGIVGVVVAIITSIVILLSPYVDEDASIQWNEGLGPVDVRIKKENTAK